MKQELQDKAVEILTQIQAGVQASAEFAAREIPEIAWSYVLYGRVYYTIIFLVCAVAFGISLLAILAGIKLERAKVDGFHLWFPGLFAAIVTSFYSSMKLPGVLLVWLAPKLWLIKEIAGLLK